MCENLRVQRCTINLWDSGKRRVTCQILKTAKNLAGSPISLSFKHSKPNSLLTNEIRGMRFLHPKEKGCIYNCLETFFFSILPKAFFNLFAFFLPIISKQLKLQILDHNLKWKEIAKKVLSNYCRPNPFLPNFENHKTSYSWIKISRHCIIYFLEVQ